MNTIYPLLICHIELPYISLPSLEYQIGDDSCVYHHNTAILGFIKHYNVKKQGTVSVHGFIYFFLAQFT